MKGLCHWLMSSQPKNTVYHFIYAIGIETEQDNLDILIKPGTLLPTSASATFEPQSHDRKKITVAIFEGLKPIGKHNHLVIKEHIKLIEQAVKMDVKLTVSQIKIITTML